MSQFPKANPKLRKSKRGPTLNTGVEELVKPMRKNVKESDCSIFTEPSLQVETEEKMHPEDDIHTERAGEQLGRESLRSLNGDKNLSLNHIEVEIDKKQKGQTMTPTSKQELECKLVKKLTDDFFDEKKEGTTQYKTTTGKSGPISS